MAEVLGEGDMMSVDRKREWHRLKDVVLSICDDYQPEVLRRCRTHSPQGNVQTTTVLIQDSSYRKSNLNIHDADARAIYDGRSHVECRVILKKRVGSRNVANQSKAKTPHHKTDKSGIRETNTTPSMVGVEWTTNQLVHQWWDV